MQIRRFIFFIAIATTIGLLLTACSGTPTPAPTPTPTPIGGADPPRRGAPLFRASR